MYIKVSTVEIVAGRPTMVSFELIRLANVRQVTALPNSEIWEISGSLH